VCQGARAATRLTVRECAAVAGSRFRVPTRDSSPEPRTPNAETRAIIWTSLTLAPGTRLGPYEITRLVFELPENVRFTSTPSRGYDVSLDGQRFVGTLVKPGPPERLPTNIELTLNWFEELRARAAAR
jgi:hypothetical protein